MKDIEFSNFTMKKEDEAVTSNFDGNLKASLVGFGGGGLGYGDKDVKNTTNFDRKNSTLTSTTPRIIGYLVRSFPEFPL